MGEKGKFYLCGEEKQESARVQTTIHNEFKQLNYKGREGG